ncbi:MAG: hypothetical protein IPG21_18020 [Saprospiraceae bacterium]|nr:hypothetical protein [Candidatus Vicinibacter affinis]
MKSQFTGILFFLLQLSLSAQFGEAFTVDYPQRLRIIDSIYTSFLLEKQSYSAIHSNLGELKELANLKKDDISLLMYSVLWSREQNCMKTAPQLIRKSQHFSKSFMKLI